MSQIDIFDEIIVDNFAGSGGVGIRCGCFHGNLKEFREIIHKTHAGTVHERLYNGVADLIEMCMDMK